MASRDPCSCFEDRTVESKAKGMVQIGKKAHRTWYQFVDEDVCQCSKTVFEASVRPKMDEDLRRLTVRAQGHLSAPTASAQLTLIGSKTLANSNIRIQPTILITCYTKECKRLIESQFKGDHKPIYLSQAGLPYLIRLKKNRVWWAAGPDEIPPSTKFPTPRDDLGISVSMEVFSAKKSPCGRMIKYEHFLKDDHLPLVRRYSRIGGIIEVGGEFFALTTAHALVLSKEEPSVRGSSTPVPTEESASDDGEAGSVTVADESIVDSDNDSDLDTQAAELPTLVSVAHFEEIDATVFWCFNSEYSPSLAVPEDMLQHYRSAGQDWALFQVSDSLVGIATNTYFPEGRTGPSVAISEVATTEAWIKAAAGPVKILVSSIAPADGFLYSGVISMYSSGHKYHVRQVRLSPSSNTPKALSGSWVVREKKLFGIVVLADVNVGSIYIVSAWATLHHVLDSVTGHTIRLPSDLLPREQATVAVEPLDPRKAAATTLQASATSGPGGLDLYGPQWTMDDRVRLLTSIIQASGADVSSWLLTRIKDANLQPRWEDVILPPGRSLNACRAMYDALLRQPPPTLADRAVRSGSVAFSDYSESGYGSQPQSSYAGVSSMGGTMGYGAPPVMRAIQPRPPHRTSSPILSDTTGEVSPSLRPFAPLDPPRKKRGRPSKEEMEERNRALAVSGQAYSPKKRPEKRPRPSQLWTPFEPAPLTSPPQPSESAEEMSIAQRRSKRLQGEQGEQSLTSFPTHHTDERSAEGAQSRLLLGVESSDARASVSHPVPAVVLEAVADEEQEREGG